MHIFYCISLTLFFIIAHQIPCHYSCLNCSSQLYIRCFACIDSSYQFTILQKPIETDPLFRHSVYETGLCIGKVPGPANPLGIIVLIVSVVGLLITQSFAAFFIVSAMQTFALYGLLQIPWLGSSAYILQNFQYFMPINLIIGPSKIKDNQLFQYGFYRLDQYMISIEDKGLIGVFGIDCVIFLAIIVIFILTLLQTKDQIKNTTLNKAKQGKQALQEQNIKHLIPQYSSHQQKQQYLKAAIQSSSDKQSPQKQNYKNKIIQYFCKLGLQCLVIRKMLHILIYIFGLLIQQTALSIIIGAVFGIGLVDIAIWIIYFIQIVVVLVISLYEFQLDRKQNPKLKKTHQFGLSLFISRECMFLFVLKKVLLPLGVVLPPSIQYLFFVFYIVLFLIQGALDSRSGRINCISRITLWKIIQIIITILMLSYFFNQKKGTTQSNALLISIILSIALVFFIVALIIELVISFFQLVFTTTKVKNQFGTNPIELNNTEIVMNQGERIDKNIFQAIQINAKSRHLQQYDQNKSQPQIEKTKQTQVQEISDIQNGTKLKRMIKDHLVVANSNSPVIHSAIDMNTIQTGNSMKLITEKSTKIGNNEFQHKKQAEDRQENQKVSLPNHLQDLDDENQEKVNPNKQNSIFNQESNRKIKPKRRIEDPELRKRYGMR